MRLSLECRQERKIYFSPNSDTTNCSYKLNTITDIMHDTKPSYHRKSLPEEYREILEKKSEVTLEENDKVMKKSDFRQIQLSLNINKKKT